MSMVRVAWRSGDQEKWEHAGRVQVVTVTAQGRRNGRSWREVGGRITDGIGLDKPGSSLRWWVQW